jgi:hypothetical protein
MQGKREKRGGYVESSFLCDDHPEKRRWQRCDSPTIPLECSALDDIDFGTTGQNAKGTSGYEKTGLIDVEKQCERLSKRSVVGEFPFQFSVENRDLNTFCTFVLLCLRVSVFG